MERDDSRGAFLPGEAAGLGTFHRVQGGDVAQVSGGPSTDAA